MKESRYFTLMIMPDTSTAEVRRVRLSRRLVLGTIAGALTLVLVALSVLARDVSLWDQERENQRLRSENEALRARAERIDLRLGNIEQTVERIDQLDAKLRASVLVSDPDRHLAIGSVGEVEAPQGSPAAEAGVANLRRDLLGSPLQSIDRVQARVSILELVADATARSVSALSAYLEDQGALLSTTPSRAPARGFISSIFGMRIDPFTGLPQMHAGLDFSANIGATVSATADGLVIFSGADSAFGKLVKIDHGHGLITWYGHLSETHAKVGRTVTRGQRIGAVGNTGRSTGPHLHYEVRLKGIAQDPHRFMLD